MADDDDLGYDDDSPGGGEDISEFVGGDDQDNDAAGAGPAVPGKSKFRAWFNARRGWILIIGLALVQGVFATIMLLLRAEAKPVKGMPSQELHDLATDLVGYEVKIGQIYQLIPGRGGKKVTIGLDIVMVLGQLEEERIEGSPRPNAGEMEMFIEAIKAMEDRIRSQVNILLQKIPTEDYGTVEVYKVIKNAVKDYVNDELDGLDFGKKLRPGIGKRRVTDVLLPMFVRQKY